MKNFDAEDVCSKRKLRKNAKGNFIIEQHEIFNGKAAVIRTAQSGKNWSLKFWIPEAKKYYRKALKTKHLEDALVLGENAYIQAIADIRSGSLSFSKNFGDLCEAFIKHKKVGVLSWIRTSQIS